MSDPIGSPPTKNRGFSRYLWLVRLLLWTFPAMFGSVPACVLPIGPEFQDPAAVPNYEPYFDTVVPFPETTQTLSATIPQTFDIYLRDPNPGDSLTVRWIANYPPFVQIATKLLVETQATPIPTDTHFLKVTSPNLTCDKFPPSSENNLVAIVSDNGFLDIKDTNFSDYDHKYSYKKNDDPKKPPILSLVMTGWRIAGCQ